MDYPNEFVEQLLGLSRSLVDDESVDPVLQRVADLAVAQLDGCDLAGVTLVRDGATITAVFTDPDAPEIDAAQYDSGRGPCLDAYRDGSILRIDDTTSETRWPEFTGTAVRHGVRSTLSLPLRTDNGTIGALNLYSLRPRAFEDNEQMATVLVAHAAAALSNSQAYWSARVLGEQLQEAMSSRAVIEQAKGILMHRERCSADAAFVALKQTSQDTNRKLRDVAASIVAEVTASAPST